MTLLEWRQATPADRPALSAFQCTVPPSKMKQRPWRETHPRRWELMLQREIHTLSPKCNSQRAVFLGWDLEGLAAVSVGEMLDGAAAAVIECVAVALRRQAPGRSGCADEALDQIIEWAIERADAHEHHRLLLAAKTDINNDKGAALLLRHGFGVGRYEASVVWFQQQIVL